MLNLGSKKSFSILSNRSVNRFCGRPNRGKILASLTH